MAIEKELLNGLNLIAEGKEEGFNILYSHTYNYVYRRAKFIMKNEEDALDLTQETFIQAYKGIGSLEDANNVYAWLGGIVYRQGMKIYRKKKKEVLVSEDAEGIFDEIVSEDADFKPEENAQAKATSEIVMSMIEELPEQQKAAILAFYYDNMKIDDIAAMCECSSNTIKSRLNYAKKYLKEKVEEHEKKNQYKLCSFSPAVLLFAIKYLLASKEYSMSEATAQTVYNATCGVVGLSPTAITCTGGAVAQTAVATQTASVATQAVASTQAMTASQVVSAGASAVVKTGLTLGAKIGIGIASVIATGALAAGIIALVDKPEEIPVIQEEIEMQMEEFSEVVEEKEEIIEETVVAEFEEITEMESVEEQPVIEAYGWEKYVGEYLYRDRAAGSQNYGYKITISDVQATSEREEDVTYDVCLEYLKENEPVREMFSGNDVGVSNDWICFQTTDQEGNIWDVAMFLMEDGSVYLSADVTYPGLGSYALGMEEPPLVFTKVALEDDFRADLDVEMGTYQFTTGNDPVTDGGYILVISEGDIYEGQELGVNFNIISADGARVDTFTPRDTFTCMQGNMCTFKGSTGWGNEIVGYFYTLEDGSIALVYDVYYLNPDMSWYGAYPDYTEEPIILIKQ